MIKTIIFDLDGTIGDTLPLCIKAFRNAMEPLIHKTISDEEIIHTFGPSEEGTIRALAPEHYEQGLNDYWSWYEKLHDMCPKPFEGIVEILDYLKANNIITAMVTGKALKSCLMTLEYYGIADYFEMIETGSPKGQRKTQGMQAVLDRYGLKPNEAIYIGDAVSDITCARAAGIPCVSVLWGTFSTRYEIVAQHPTYVFERVEELKDFLLKAVSKDKTLF